MYGPYYDPKYCKYCGNYKSDHEEGGASWRRCYGFVPMEKPACRVCGGRFNPAKSGREDCCYRHRFDS